ncbi:hydroxylamine reductase [Methanocorpusculum sp. MG]|uniref:Hydroxylamine reductase n=1 Tax=Methanocorpusculum petauri TaxID=3002863 RepID=A0ABT4IIF6_9EURY|nr:hydroxylamine reductase [Methanocorpusculum petauri]MCZ0860940.1 hydroxylamine reductase [Methanocorpusculum petauri]
MYCQQCQESKTPACTLGGACGKNKIVAEVQDRVLYSLSALSFRAKTANTGLDPCVLEALFATLTNVSFDETRFNEYLSCITSHYNALPPAAGEPVFDAPAGLDAISDPNTRSLFSLLLFGVKGLAAYYSHAIVLGKTDDAILSFIRDALASRFEDLTIDQRTALVLECGKHGVAVLALLDAANQTYGVPEITSVSTSAGLRPGILVTGHDLKDLAMLLEATKDEGIDIYTHGEMLPAHAYPAFKKYPQLRGNFGGSWAEQRMDLAKFHGPVLFTTNCLVPPAPAYADKVFTTGAVSFPNCPHIDAKPDGSKDFSALIALARTCRPPEELGRPDLLTGCAHDAVLALAPKVIELIKGGKIRRFVVMAGCDGRDKRRSYYTEFAKALPHDTIILTAGCVKYRYNALALGDIDGIPRVLDAGQCNDSYSLVVIALALADAFGCGINDLPISYNIAWYEQKAVLVLLALLHLGVKNIMLGPSLPEFVSPDVLNVLVTTFGLQSSSTVAEDLVKLSCV